jgi:molybdopterin/thiamine biosynthesis adenylyltransferase/rhodanese-related sulfurtransferase
MANNDERYDRQIILKNVGLQGQKTLSESKVLCVGAGGLGSPVLLYLAAAGIGTLGVMDDDKVHKTNLHRQILFSNHQVGKLKADTARIRIEEQNPHVKCVSHPFQLKAANAREIVSQYDLVIDGTDNFESKFLINDVCASLEKPWIYGSVNQWEGHVAAFFSKMGPCYRCLYPNPPEVPVGNCSENGVMGATVGVIGSWQAILAIRVLILPQNTPWGKLQVVNTLSGDSLNIQIEKNSSCLTCSQLPEKIILKESREKILWEDVLKSPEVYQPMDVRTLEEWHAGHLPNALHWPLSEMEKGNLPKEIINTLERNNRKLLLYCQGGKRSEKAGDILYRAGFTKIVELKGGISQCAL